MSPTAPANFPAPPEPPNLGALWARWPGAAFRLDAEFRWTWLGESVEALTGRSARAWLAEPSALEQAVHPLDRARHAAHRRSLPRQTGGASLRFRLLQAKSGAVIWLHEFCLPEFDAAGKLLGFAGLWIDDTRAARLEQRLAGTAWIATRAAMTAGMAHDFNNVLTGMISVSEHFLAQLPSSHPFRESLTLLRENGLGASRWLQRFALLQQAGPGAATWHDVNVLVAGTVEILRHTLSRRYELSAQCAAEPAPVVVEAAGFQRTLLMLAFRAAARMKHPGPIRWKVAHDSAPGGDAAWASVGVEVPGELWQPAASGETDAAAGAAGEFAARFGGILEIDRGTPTGTATWLRLPAANAQAAAPKPATPEPNRWVLLGGGSPAQIDAWAGWLRGRSYLVTVPPADGAELPESDDYLWDAAVIVINAEASGAAMKFLDHVRTARPELPVVTVLPEGIGFDVEARFGQVTTLVAAGEDQRGRLLAKLAAARSLP